MPRQFFSRSKLRSTTLRHLEVSGQKPVGGPPAEPLFTRFWFWSSRSELVALIPPARSLTARVGPVRLRGVALVRQDPLGPGPGSPGTASRHPDALDRRRHHRGVVHVARRQHHAQRTPPGIGDEVALVPPVARARVAPC